MHYSIYSKLQARLFSCSVVGGHFFKWKKVTWSDESQFTLFQSDGGNRTRTEADKVPVGAVL